MPTPSNFPPLKPSEVADVIDICIDVKQPLCIWGEPGTAKSSVVHQTAARRNLQLRDIRAVLLDPVDLRGLPHVNGDGRAHWAIPEFLPRDGAGIIFLDELNRAPVMVQNACFQLVLDRRIGEYVLPPDWTVIAACNREQDGGGVIKMSSALVNRFEHVEQIPDLDDWCKWAVANNIEPAVIAFLRFRPDLLHRFDRNAKAWPSMRSWSFVSRITGAKPKRQNIEHAMYAGAVGDAEAVEFSAFLRLFRNLPSIDAILLNPTAAQVPTDPATLYAVAVALGRRATSQNIGRVVQYLDRVPATEYAVVTIKDAVSRDASIATTPEFTRWMVAHQDVTL
jgi:MoxR-like ATPase